MLDKYDSDSNLYIVYKQPSENLLLDMEMENRMRSGDTIASVISTEFENLGEVEGSADITIDSASFSGTTVQIRILGGEHLEKYKITSLVTTTAGDTIEADGLLYCVEM